jgi:hypothetical protein
MRRDFNSLTKKCEEVLGGHVVELLSEFRSYEVADLIALIKLDRIVSLRSLVESDCEVLFKPRTMAMGEHAEVVVRWDVPPKIRLGMVFRNRGVELYYRLTLEAFEAAVEIDFLRFLDPNPQLGSRINRLDAALSDARITKPLI